MDTAEPPRILLESAGPCPNAPALEALLESSLGRTHFPRAGWQVALRLEKTTARVLRAEGDITDSEGTPVARRVVSGSLADCNSLARAIGVWASLVLDAESSRRETATDAPIDEPDRAGPPRESVPSDAARVGPTPADARSAPVGSAEHAQALSPVTTASALYASPPRPQERPQEESGALPARAEPRALELGLGTFLMVGPDGKAIAGITPYAFIEAGSGVFLRPSLAIGEGLLGPSSNEQLIWAITRIDACFRIRGLYPANYGLKCDLCAGADGGFTYRSTNAGDPISTQSAMRPFISMGPSVEMDGDLAGALSLVLRGVAGVNVLPDGWSGRIEVALSWRLR